MVNCFVGRQPIFNRNLKLHAYELLFRSNLDNKASFKCGNEATSQVVMNAFIDIGLEKIANNRLVFVNMTRQFLTDPLLFTFPPEQVVIEILEDIEIDEEVLESVRCLKSKGYCIALDDFIYKDGYAPLVDLADVVKLDIMEMEQTDIQHHLELLKPHNVKLLAEKVESREEFELYHSYGFDYFQGYFFSKPKTFETQRLPHNKLVILQLLAKVSNMETETEELLQIIAQDPALSLRILRYINSPLSGLNRKIDSIYEAIIYMGRNMLRTMVMLITLAKYEDTNPELMLTAMTRARTCELLTHKYGQDGDNGTAFTVGLFSTLDAILGTSIQEVIDSIALSNPIKRALLSHLGPYGEALECTLHLEKGDEAGFHYNTANWQQIADIYTDAVQWADSTQHALD